MLRLEEFRQEPVHLKEALARHLHNSVAYRQELFFRKPLKSF
jgi:hypothetical protein